MENNIMRCCAKLLFLTSPRGFVETSANNVEEEEQTHGGLGQCVGNCRSSVKDKLSRVTSCESASSVCKRGMCAEKKAALTEPPGLKGKGRCN